MLNRDARSHMNRRIQSLKQSGKDEIIESLTKQLEDQSGDPGELYYQRGVQAMGFALAPGVPGDLRAQMTQQAISDFTEVLKIVPDFADAFYHRGMTRLYTSSRRDEKALEEARADFDAALLQPNSLENQAIFYYNRGIAFLWSALHLQALNDFEEAMRLNPKDDRFIQRRDEARTMWEREKGKNS